LLDISFFYYIYAEFDLLKGSKAALNIKDEEIYVRIEVLVLTTKHLTAGTS